MLLRAKLLTGRTHQIRLHAAHVGLPLAGDARYGGPAAALLPSALARLLAAAAPAAGSSSPEVCSPSSRSPPGGDAPVAAARIHLLHAWKLSLTHPRTGALLELEAPLPAWATACHRLEGGLFGS